MILPGSRYQEPGWERVKRLLGIAGRAALGAQGTTALPQTTPEADCLAFAEQMAASVMRAARPTDSEALANHVGDTPLQLALSLVAECSQFPVLFVRHSAKIHGLPRVGTTGRDAKARKLIEQYFLELRDEVDAREIAATTGAPWSANKLWVYRKIDETWREVDRLLSNRVVDETRPLVEAILQRPLEVGVTPIEGAYARRRRGCRPEWIIRWSEAQRGWMHNSKRAEGWRTRPDRVAAVLGELADGDEMFTGVGKIDVYGGRDGVGTWLVDYDQVIDASERHDPGCQREPLDPATVASGWDAWSPEALAAAQEEAAEADVPPDDGLISPADDLAEDTEEPTESGGHVGAGVPHAMPLRPVTGGSPEPGLGLPPGYSLMAQRLEDTESELYELLSTRCSLWTRMQIYRQYLGAADPSYPEGWRLPESRCLPTQSQLAALEGVSVPTFMRRVKAALLVLQESALGLTRQKS